MDIYVEPKIGDLVIVHDAGKTSAELYAQGIHLTDNRQAQLKALAERYGVSYVDGTFTIVTRADRVQRSILAIAQCASMGMHDAMAHVPVIEAEPISAIVKRTMTHWKPNEFIVKHRFQVKGGETTAQHTFDSVAFPRIGGRKTVAVKTLALGYGSQIQARLYGFMALDIRGTEFEKWQRIAVVSKVEQWAERDLKFVRDLSAKTLEVKTGEDGRIEQELPVRVDELSRVA